MEVLCTLQLENVIADGDRLLEVADLAGFLERVEENAAQGKKRIDSRQVTGITSRID